MWPFPFAPHIKGEGLYFPQITNFSKTEVKQTEINKNDLETLTECYIAKAKKKYAGSTFVLKTEEAPYGFTITVPDIWFIFHINFFGLS